MPKNRVYLTSAGEVVALHPESQAVPLSAYPRAAEIAWIEAEFVPSLSIMDDATYQARPRFLPPDWRKSIGEGAPSTISKGALRRALRHPTVNLIAQFDAAVAAAPEDLQDDFASFTSFSRTDPTVEALAQVVLSGETKVLGQKGWRAQLDAIFRLGDSLVSA